MIKLITVSDDRAGRKGGMYNKTQKKMMKLLGDWIEQRHFTYMDFKNCDPLMENVKPEQNGRVYKPWSIKQELSDMEEGEFLLYNDCSPELWSMDSIDLGRYDLSVIMELTRHNKDFLVPFVKWSDEPIPEGGYGKHTHRWFTSESCIEKMGGERYRDSYLCASGMICIRKTEQTVGIVDNWLHYNRIPECACIRDNELEDSYWDVGNNSKLGNRHDQSILSMLLNQQNYSFVDIVYNDMNPHNFLNFCIPGHEYTFINSNGRKPRNNDNK